MGAFDRAHERGRDAGIREAIAVSLVETGPPIFSEREQRRSERRRRRRIRCSPDRRANPYGSDTHTGVACPVCRAEAGDPCRTRRRTVRASVHKRRKDLSRATTPSCDSCGACCLSRVWGDGERAAEVPFVDVDARELHRYAPDELIRFPAAYLESKQALRVEGGRCFALVGPIPGARCGIYDRRPATCASFIAGSYRCRTVRARALLAPFPHPRRR